MAQLLVNVGKQLQGYAFRLQPLSRRWLVEQFPDAPRVASVFISVDTKQDFSHIDPIILNRVFALLTGLYEDEIEEYLDGVAIIALGTGEELYNSRHGAQHDLHDLADQGVGHRGKEEAIALEKLLIDVGQQGNGCAISHHSCYV